MASPLTFNTLILEICIFSLYCSLCIAFGADEENLFNNQELLKLIIIFSILVT